jgi:hypothetical protein
MLENNWAKNKQKPYKKPDSNYSFKNLRQGYELTPEQVAELMLNRPELRLQDHPANIELAQILTAAKEDSSIQELFQLVYHEGLGKAIVTQDEFLGNYPPKGGISYPNGFRPLGVMPTGDSIGIVISQLTGNILMPGRTKSGKTSLLTELLISRDLLTEIVVIAFVKKPELRNLATIPELMDLVVTFMLEDLALCYCQPPPGVPQAAWNNETTKIPAQCYARFSAQRLMGEMINELTSNRPEGIFPSIRNIADAIDMFRPRFGTREAAYKESILWCLKDLMNCTGRIWDYGYSNFLEHLYAKPGLYIIEAEALPQEHLSFIATFFMRWLYFRRIYDNEVVV